MTDGITIDRFAESYRWRGLAEMFVFGNLGMLIGWWADVGFGPIIRDGVCLCCCTKSGGGHRSAAIRQLDELRHAARFTPDVAAPRRLARGWTFPRHAGRHVRGDAGGGILPFKLVVVDPIRHFYLAAAALGVAMSLGMLLACEAWRKIFTRAPAPNREPVGAVEA